MSGINNGSGDEPDILMMTEEQLDLMKQYRALVVAEQRLRSELAATGLNTPDKLNDAMIELVDNT